MTIDDLTTSNPTPFGLAPGAGEARWFGESLQIIKASAATTGGRFALIEDHATEGPAAPLHVHSRESEWWYVLEGELAVWAAGELIDAPAGAFVLGPAGAPHTFSVVSPHARFLVGIEPAGLEEFFRACSEPAQAPTMPPRGATGPDPARLAALAAEYGVEILGPPGIPS